MTAPTAGPRSLDRLRPVGWAGLAVGAALVASVLTGALANTTLPVLVGTSVTRSGMNVAGVACVGFTLLALLLPPARHVPGSALRTLERVRATADRALVAVAGTWLVLVLVGIMFRTADAFGRPLGQLAAGEIGSFITELAGGRGLALTAVCTAALLVCAALRLRDRALVQARVPLVAALLGLVTPAVTGHAGTHPDHQLAIMSIGVHVVGAALWVGGLAVVLALVARHRALLDPVLPRFSRLAGWCIAAVTITGLLTAVIRLGTWDAILGTRYGVLVLTKIACLVLLGLLGGLARRRLAAGRTPVLRWAGYEVALMAATIGIAAALSQSA
ncbi:copper resistance D family protein [Pseudonocardia cypriaca]|uniref:Putative copper resistance protein D n=1 Tax=Pseudonocardia cypriaca TaxID=882449 RepID=A0A543FQF1_9PSEU|nr:CopD family protein [Pseudonocardia cypriaca]TQM36069.1 putative copper resistance protein D [Pseudonocardia cypriaca]